MMGAAAVAAYATVKSDYVFAQAMEGPFKQVPLPYASNKNEPHIDTMTMEIHHGRHHVAFINNLNNAAKDNADLFKRPIQDLLANISSVPENLRTLIRNSGGGHANHIMFWQVMGGSGGAPSGEIAGAINTAFGDFGKLQETFNARGVGVVGVEADGGEVPVARSPPPNQDTPWKSGQSPIFGNGFGVDAY